MKLFKLCILAVSLTIIGVNCSSTGTATTESVSKAPSSIYPIWYQTSGYLADSTSFHAFGTAISADSATAMEKAEQQARIILESEIAELTEDIRQEMIDEGSTDAANTDFIIILRTAHSLVQDEANVTQSIARVEDGTYRGFSAVRISKPETVSILEKGFTGHPRYWGGFSGATMFKALFE